MFTNPFQRQGMFVTILKTQMLTMGKNNIVTIHIKYKDYFIFSKSLLKAVIIQT